MTLEEALQLVEQALEHEHLNKVEELVFRQVWQGQSYAEIAKATGYDAGYLKDTGYRLWQKLSETYGEKITKHNLRGVLQRSIIKPNLEPIKTERSPHRDWGEAVDVSLFYGRPQELSTLQQWIVQDRCRLVTLCGMGGMGKTSLSVKLAEEVQTDFEYLIWRSLRDVPTIDELLILLIQLLSNQQDLSFAQSSSGKLSRLIELLKRSRCLIILDNFEAVLQSGKRTGTYREGYEMYGELLKRVGEIAHQSCMVLTSREKPQEASTLEGDRLPVRTLLLAGLDLNAAQQILDAKGLRGTSADLEQLITYYRGNPLALKIAATSIQDLFAGDPARFLEQGSLTFIGVEQLVHQQCDRLTAQEQSIIDWLTLNRESMTLIDLEADLINKISRSKLLRVLESLQWRSLIESSVAGFTLQPAVMDTVTESLIKQIASEIEAESPQLFLSHALLKAEAKDYVRESQIRTIVQPLIDRLLLKLGSPKQLIHKLKRLLVLLRTDLDRPGYAAGNLLNLFWQLETDLTDYDFSGLSIWQAYLQEMNLHRVNFDRAEFVNCAFASTFGGVTSIAFSLDERYFATSDTNGGIQIWQMSTFKQQAICEGHNSWVWSVAFSPTQPILVSGGQDHQVRVWEVHTGQCLKVLEGHTGIVTSVAVSHDGEWIASTSGDRTIRLWRAATGDSVQILKGHAACVWSAVFHPDGKTLLSAGEDNVIRVWEIGSGRCIQTLSGHQHWIRSIALNSTGTLLASGSFDQTLKLWNLETGSCLATFSGHYKPVTAVAFSPDSSLLASSSYDQTIKLWCVASGQCRQTFQKHTNSVWSVKFHPTRALVASGGEDYTTRFWDIKTGQCIKTLQGYSNSIYTIALSANQHLLASGHEDQTIKLWDFDDQTLRSTASPYPFRSLRGHTGRVFSVAFSPEGDCLASASADRTIKLWSPYTGQCLQTLHGHHSWVWATVFSPDGRQIASASYDHTIKLWDVPTGECLHTLKDHTSSVLTIAFSPDGKWIASGGYEQTIKLWNAKTGQCLNTLQAHLNRVWAVTFSSDSRWLATAGDDRTIKLWDALTGHCLKTFEGHGSQVLSLLFSPGNQTLISSSADKTIRVWDVNLGTCLAVLKEHQNWVWSLVQSPDGAIVLSGGQDETIKAWRLQARQCLKTLRVPRPYEGMSTVDATGLTEAQEATLSVLGATRQ